MMRWGELMTKEAIVVITVMTNLMTGDDRTKPEPMTVCPVRVALSPPERADLLNTQILKISTMSIKQEFQD
jgi:hypothetical protein